MGRSGGLDFIGCDAVACAAQIALFGTTAAKSEVQPLEYYEHGFVLISSKVAIQPTVLKTHALLQKYKSSYTKCWSLFVPSDGVQTLLTVPHIVQHTAKDDPETHKYTK